jgi:hypothetical protein
VPTASPHDRAAGARLSLAGACLALIAAVTIVLAAPAEAGQIVYSHGGDLWTMNDDGSGQRPLATAAQIGGAIDAGSTADPQPVSIQPGGTGIAFVAPPGGSCPVATTNCPAMFSLIGGHLDRLTAPSSPCGSALVTFCASEEEDPAVIADGRLVYERLDTAGTFTCLYYCGTTGGYSESFYVRRLDGSDAPVAWPLPALESDPDGLDPSFEGPLASDPADPAKLAYQGHFVSGTPETLYPVDVDDTAAPPGVAQPAFDDGFLYGLAFSGDGGLVADIETGGDKGIWVYPSGQDANSPGAAFHWALEDPDNGRGTSLDHVFAGLAFVGQGALVFGADYNLYSLPARCWATAVGSTPEPSCRFPQDATQLTFDGTAAAPDAGPAWTSSMAPIAVLSTPAAPAAAVPATPAANRGGRESGGDRGRPGVSAAALRGVSTGRPRLSFEVAAAPGAPALRRIGVRLPAGLAFARRPKALRAGIVLRSAGRRLGLAARVLRGALSIVPAKPALRFEVDITAPALRVTRALAARVRSGRTPKLRVKITATDAAGVVTHLFPTVRPR